MVTLEQKPFELTPGIYPQALARKELLAEDTPLVTLVVVSNLGRVLIRRLRKPCLDVVETTGDLKNRSRYRY